MADALETLYWKHRQGLFTLALSITRCPQRAEDAVQNAFERMWRRGLAPGADAPYVFAAVRRAAIDQIRRGRRERTTDASIFNGRAAPSAGTDPIAAAEREQRARAALESLADEERQAVVLKIWADLTFDEIARILGEPLSTVASRYRRALGRLRERMEPEP